MQEPNSGDSPKTGEAAHINIDAVRELVGLMGENDLVELEYEHGDLAIRLSKRPPAMPTIQATTMAPAAVAPQAPAAAAAPAPAADDKLQPIASPMVGTFYSASSPDSDAFVSVGDEVSEDTVVCLIEAMKVFNEIKAGVRGRVAKVCAANEDTVEFGQALFLVEPS